jgi:hypothetical protein
MMDMNEARPSIQEEDLEHQEKCSTERNSEKSSFSLVLSQSKNIYETYNKIPVGIFLPYLTLPSSTFTLDLFSVNF